MDSTPSMKNIPHLGHYSEYPVPYAYFKVFFSINLFLLFAELIGM